MKWKLKNEVSIDEVYEIAEKYNANPLMAKILLNRINDKETARIAFQDLHEAIIPPERLVNGQAVADRISEHINKGSVIHIHADYDVDGLNSGFIFGDVIREIISFRNTSSEVEVYYPEREHGYGLSFWYADKIKSIKASMIENGDNREILVLTCDNGISQVQQIESLLECEGIEVVVTDHHPSKEEVAPCLICNPRNKFVEQDDTFHHLCGTAVVFKVCELLQKNYGYHDMTKYIANVAMATIADVMPMHLENIAMVKYGLELINSDYCPENIKALRDFIGASPMNSIHLGWEVGPMLNACGRMGNTALGGKFMEAKTYDEAEDLVNDIAVTNDARKEITKKIKDDIAEMNFDYAAVCILKLEDVPEGIVGVIAGYMTEKFNKPSIVVCDIGDGLLNGSARSVEGISLTNLFEIEQSKGNIVSFGGHAEASGISFMEDKMDDLQLSLNNTIADMICTQSVDEDYEEQEEILHIDECIEISHLNKTTYDLINEFPYDNETFKKPVFALTNCKVTEYNPTGTNPDNIWLSVRQGRMNIKLWCQNMTRIYKELGCPSKVHLAGYIDKNFMKGSRPYTFKVIDIADASA